MVNHSGEPSLLRTMEEAFKCYYRPLNLYALHYLQDVDSAEDVVQECFVALWEKLHSDAEISHLKAYLYQMVRNRCIDHLKQANVTDDRIDAAGLANSVIDDEYQEGSETEARLWTAIDSLPEKCREALLLSKRDGLKYQEIAARMGISVNTVENHINKALKVLRTKAKDIYYFFFG